MGLGQNPCKTEERQGWLWGGEMEIQGTAIKRGPGTADVALLLLAMWMSAAYFNIPTLKAKMKGKWTNRIMQGIRTLIGS